MNARNIGVACGLLLLAAVPATEASAQGAPDEVERVLSEFLIPFSAGNVAGFIEYFAEDATLFMPPTAVGASPRRIQGRAAIEREFSALFKGVQAAVAAAGRPGPAIQPQDLSVQYFSEFAVATFHLGTEASRGRRTFVLRRIGNGWRIVHLHASTFPAR